MAFKKIVVPLTGADADRVVLAGAIAAAKPFDGHVQALFVTPDPREALPYVGMPVPPEVLQQIIDSATVIAEAASKAAHANLDAAARDGGATVVAAPTVRDGVTCSLREVQGGFLSQVLEAGKLADLIVFGTSTTEGGPDISGAFIEALTRGIRPVLLMPKAPIGDLRTKIVIGWDGSLASAHALSAALPFLAQAGSVEIYSVQAKGDDGASLDAPIAYLKLHGINALPRVIDPAGSLAGETLLAEAAGAGASMLVLGGYGHSRLSETLFGGTTVHVAAHATLPLFMVH